MICPGCLAEQESEGYCKKCLRALVNGKRGHVLSFNSPYTEKSALYTNLAKKISLSGVQVKYSMKLEGGDFVLTDRGGQYMLKPVPSGQFRHLDQAPANEHLTMQIARQCFDIDVPPNAIVQFRDGGMAYLVKRFDVRPDDSRIQQEDFAQIAQITESIQGRNYKYDLAYEDIAELIRAYIPMHQVEMEKFFRLVLFNYVFSNGDAHIKNFSAFRSSEGDYVLTPAYDLLCTAIHTPDEGDMALTLFKDISSPGLDTYGFYIYDDFLAFGERIGIKRNRVVKIIDTFQQEKNDVIALIERSLLAPEVKELYKHYYKDRTQRLLMTLPPGS